MTPTLRCKRKVGSLLLGGCVLWFAMLCAQAALVTRGPYLQQGTTNSVVVRWRTDVPTDSLVRYGLTAGNLANVASDAAALTEHIVTISGLQIDAAYFYQIGSSTAWFPLDTNNFFSTAPPIGVAKQTRIWVIGDAGTGSSEQAAVRDGYTAYTGARHTDLWLMLGDNAYDSGLDTEYQTAVFNMYPTYLRNTMLFPTLGNHDAGSTGPTGQNPYFDMFTLPQNGEAGGLASGTEHYYSVDYANIHLVCLDSTGSDRGSNGPMCNWLAADLAATTQDWIIAYWHHPPYSKGSHDSDTESALIEMRENVLPILESYGIDLVLSGHSHAYERSFLLDGHYGLSTTLTPAMKIDGGDGRENGVGAYRKPAGTPGHQGAVYTVAGSSGKVSGGSLDHPAMFISLAVLGSLAIDVNGDRLDVVFLQTNGVAGDYFTILKAPPPTNAPAAPTNLIAIAVSSSQIDLSWADASDNEAGFKLDRSTNGVDFAPAGAVGAGVTNKHDTGLSPATTYYYRVHAFNVAGDSLFSNVAQETTLTNSPDITQPAAVADLAASGATMNSVRLSWTAPGDDGNVGIAARYDVRYSTALITEGNWAAAVQAAGEPAPAVAGTPQSFTVTGLAAGTPYYFGLKTADETNNVSPLSNVPLASTSTNATQDTTPPAAVTNLAVTGMNSNSVTLRWTAPGDNGNSGTASLYDIRFSTAVITEANWAAASQVVGEPDPLAAKTVQTFILNGLVPVTTYYFALKTSDAAGNLSPLSNVPGATTLPTLIPPAGPTALRAIGIASNEIDLTWTDNAGNEDGFNVERSYDGVNFAPLTNMAPNITNLADKAVQPGTFNFYRVRSYNAAGNSPYSNTNSALAASSSGGSTLTILIASNAVWKYLDNGSDQGNAWTAVAYNDTAWASGAAILGYAGGHETTTVSYGPNSSAKYITTYFRRHFTVSDPSSIISLTASLLRDDGGVVYLNGAEVFRSNMPTGAVDYLTPAPMSVVSPDKSLFHDSPPLDSGLLLAGDNVVAVEIHQHSGSSTAMDFALQLISTNRLTISTRTIVLATPGTASTGDLIRFVSGVTNAQNGAPVSTGTVTFREGSTILSGPIALDGNGDATLTDGFGEGSHTITATYNGSAGSFAASLGEVTVNICASPANSTPHCPSNILVTATGVCPAVVTFAIPNGGACGLSNVTANPPPGSRFPVGTNLVRITASDGAGNTNSCAFQVVVVPGPAPRVRIAQAGTNLVLSWPDAFGCYTLRSTARFLSPPGTNVWSAYQGQLWTNGGSIFVTNGARTSSLFYRLAY